MKILLLFYRKGGESEMADLTEALKGQPIPRIKEWVFCDESHKGFVFGIEHNYSRQELLIKIR